MIVIKQHLPTRTQDLTDAMLDNVFMRFGSKGFFAARERQGIYIIGEGDIRNYASRPDAILLQTSDFGTFKQAIIGANDQATVTTFTGYFYNTRMYAGRIPNAMEYLGGEILGISASDFMRMDDDPRTPFIGNRYDHIMHFAQKIVSASVQLQKDIREVRAELAYGRPAGSRREWVR